MGEESAIGREGTTNERLCPGASKSHTTKSHSSNKQRLNNPNASCPSSSGSPWRPTAAFQPGSQHGGQQRAPVRPH